MNPIITIKMASGKVMKAELYPEMAPNTVANFVSLVKKGFYDGKIFHRVIPGFMIQGGCPDGTGMGNPGYQIKGEFRGNGFKQNTLRHEAGVLSMARAFARDSGGSQFFLMVEAAPHLDGDYAGFGKLIEGLEVAREIVAVPRNREDRPNDPQVMESVTVENADNIGEPETMASRF